jgi:hypothetical protein
VYFSRLPHIFGEKSKRKMTIFLPETLLLAGWLAGWLATGFTVLIVKVI